MRQRAYLRDWIRDHYVPAPRAFGLDRMILALAHPPIDRVRPLVERWRSQPENVLLWASDQGVFGVFLSGRTADMDGLAGADDGSPVERMEVPCHREAVPAFFDFELAWARANGLPGVSGGYPRSVPEPGSADRRTDPPPPSERQKLRIRRLVASPSEHSPPSSGLRLFGGGIEERGARMGWVAFRSMLHPMALAASVTGFPGWIGFVRGNLLPSIRASDLFPALADEMLVSPFLFATDGRRVFFAVLSAGPGSRRTVPRKPVLPTLQTFLREIAVTQWPLVSTRAITDHRYDRVLDLARQDGTRPPHS